MANPFEDPDASYRVSREPRGSAQPVAGHPAHAAWLDRRARLRILRASCLEYIEKNWTDMRPKSLIKAQGV